MSIRRFLCLILFLFLIGSSVAAWTYLADETIIVGAAAIGLTKSKIRPNTGGGTQQPTIAVCRLEAAEIRYWVSGTSPTSGNGTLLEVGDILPLQGHDVLENFLAIKTGATNGILSCTYSSP